VHTAYALYIKELSWFGPSQQPKDSMAALLPLPPPGWGENGEKKAKPAGQAKGSVTDRQRERTGTATTLTRRIHKTNGNAQSNSHRPLPSAAPAANPLPPGRPTPWTRA